MRATDIVRHRQRRARQAEARGPRLVRGAAVAGLAFLLLLILVPVIGAAAGAAGLLALTRDMPDVTALEQLPARFRPSPATTRLYAREPSGNGLILIDAITDPRLDGAGWIGLGELPAYVPGAFNVAVHPSPELVDTPSVAAFIAGGWRVGALGDMSSSLTRQLIRDHLRGSVPALPGDGRRAFQDWLLARQIERRYSPEQQLEWALNTTYFGRLAYGIEAAARVYFSKGAADLTPGEAALLAAIARNPAANPFDNPAAARSGQAAVLGELTAAGVITPEAAEAAVAAPLALAAPPGSDSLAPSFVRLARSELETVLGPATLLSGDLFVETTLDWALQEQVACAASARLAARAPDPAFPAGGGPPCLARELLPSPAVAATAGEASSVDVVALDPATGEIEALLGAAWSPRPVGSLVRPLIYLTALSRGYTAATLTMDVETIYLQNGQPYGPRNADGRFLGPLRLRQALATARAVPATQVLGWVGVAQVLATARALGMEPSATAGGLSFAEDGFAASLIDVSAAFGTLGNGGTATGRGDLLRPTTIRRVADALDRELYAYQPATRGVLTPELAYLMTDMLADDGARCPTADCEDVTTLPDDRRAAIAVGESPGGDAWAVGYTPQRLIGVHVGGDGASSSADAGPLWRALMSHTASANPPADWPRPAGLRRVEVCAVSGLLPADAACPTIREWFIPGTEPTAADTMTREVAINRETGRLATIFTPPSLIERRAYIAYPPEAAAWAAAAGIEPPPTEYDTIRRVPTRAGEAMLLSPEPWSVISGQWPIVGSAGGDDFAYYRLAYFPGLLPEAMQTVVARGETPNTSADLGVWDSTLVADGLYTLLLTVVRHNGTFDEVAIPVTVMNGSVGQ